MTHPHRLVIIGGGFAGLSAAFGLRRAAVDITLVDRRNFHLFQPLLYQVATGGLSPANISAPLRSVLKRQKNARVLLAEVCDFDLANRRVILTDDVLDYDTLVVATGATHHYFGNDHWESLAPGLKIIEDATEIRRRVFRAFEAAERAERPEKVQELLTFVVVGGGPTEVELAGALAEIARDTLTHEFRSIDPADARIVLLEGTDRVLPSDPGSLPAKAKKQLDQLGVMVRTGTLVSDIAADHVTIRAGEQTERIPTRTVLWVAGVKASNLSRRIVLRHSSRHPNRAEDTRRSMNSCSSCTKSMLNAVWMIDFDRTVDRQGSDSLKSSRSPIICCSNSTPRNATPRPGTVPSTSGSRAGR